MHSHSLSTWRLRLQQTHDLNLSEKLLLVFSLSFKLKLFMILSCLIKAASNNPLVGETRINEIVHTFTSHLVRLTKDELWKLSGDGRSHNVTIHQIYGWIFSGDARFSHIFCCYCVFIWNKLSHHISISASN
jgi:hypothetical protein